MKSSQINPSSQVPSVGENQIQLLKRLCDASGVSGDEGEVRAIVLEQIRLLGLDFSVDPLGNVLAIRPGDGKTGLRVMVAAHMDEVGMMITKDEGDGIFRFEPVGGLNPRMLAGKTVRIGKSHISGVVGVKPIHLSTDSAKPISVEDLRIDVSPDNGLKVKVGDWATFGTDFQRWGPSICGKALDDRIGVAILIDILRSGPSNIEILAAFTVQEEVGLIGAQVAAYTLNPDIAIVVDCTPARDFPVYPYHQREEKDVENYLYNTKLGNGPAIYLADKYTIYDPRLIRHMIQSAEQEGIPYQLRQPGGGGNDAGAIHRQRAGIPTISVSVPGRYAHSGLMIARISDWSNTLRLVYHALDRLNPEILASDR